MTLLKPPDFACFRFLPGRRGGCARPATAAYRHSGLDDGLFRPAGRADNHRTYHAMGLIMADVRRRNGNGGGRAGGSQALLPELVPKRTSRWPSISTASRSTSPARWGRRYSSSPSASSPARLESAHHSFSPPLRLSGRSGYLSHGNDSRNGPASMARKFGAPSAPACSTRFIRRPIAPFCCASSPSSCRPS